QTIRSGRNRTESYHQLQRTIRKIYSGAFKGRRKVDNAVSNHASRLVANLIIAYNAKLLNSVYLRLAKSLGEEVAKRSVARISPVAWEHIIVTGR
ncbi:MAG: transposase, partial [Gammaproteobacteria bacterium]|nr:transposase [Gammaproteobacteria bacterium]